MRARPFRQVDVFGAQPFAGNPLAVVLDGSGLADEEMQRFARWTQLSETTFLTPPTDPGADYAVRIFTPGGELPFAGHPTLGSCHAWLAAGGRPRAPAQIVQQCGVGLVRIRADGERLAFAAPRAAPGRGRCGAAGESARRARAGRSAGAGRALAGQRAALAVAAPPERRERACARRPITARSRRRRPRSA